MNTFQLMVSYNSVMLVLKYGPWVSQYQIYKASAWIIKTKAAGDLKKQNKTMTQPQFPRKFI